MLTSLHNPLVKHVVSLQRRKGREQAGEFMIEGRRFLEEALRRGASITQTFLVPERKQPEWEPLLAELARRRIPVEEVDERVVRKLSLTVEPQGMLALVKQVKYGWADVILGPDTVLLILDGIQDPGNLGTILRTALAAGVQDVCLTKGTVDLYNDKVLRSTMGAVFSLKILCNQEPNEILNFCRANSLRLALADVEGTPPYSSGLLKPPLALVIGNEGNGPHEIFRSAAAERVAIPMFNQVESLNAAVATAILLYETVRQRDFL
ncbi:MAG: TrmH family RNA methyltransferase [Desulfitobacteriaceae bacterium]